MTKRKRTKVRRTPPVVRPPYPLAPWMAQGLYWAPRMLGILFTLYVASFAGAAFDEGLPLLETIGALFINLLPAAVTGGALAIAWRNELRGGLLLVGVGILFGLWFGRAGNTATMAALVAPPVWAGVGFITGAWLGATHARRTRKA